MFSKSLTTLAIALITPFIAWLLLKNLADNSSSAHDPDPWIQGLVDAPKVFKKNSLENGWFKIVSKNSELLWQKEDQEFLPLSDLPVLTEKSVFFVTAAGPKAAYLFFDFLKTKNYLKQSLILSSSDGFLKDLQFYDGQLQLSCGQAFLVRFRMLDQLGLSNFMKTSMSAAWLDQTLFANYIGDFIHAFKKRRVPIFLGPQESAVNPSEALTANILIN